MPQTKFSWKNYTKHRVIVTPQDHDGGPREYMLLEVSPSGEMLKFQNSRGKTFWCPHNQYLLVEDLGEGGGQ